MARRVKDATLDTREARRKLKPQGKPYYRMIDRGLHLGYRKLQSGAGTWVARHYVGAQKYEVESIGAADDLSDADGKKILTFWQAQDKARERMGGRTETDDGKSVGPLTVAQAMDDYLEFLESNRKSAGDARYRDRAFIRPALGEIEVAALTHKKIERWLADLAKTAPRLRTRKDKPQKHREMASDEDSKRRRRATANRTLTVLKAALNRAWRKSEGRLSDAAWRSVEPFENVDAARVRYLSVDEAQRLINASDGDFRKLVQAGLQTGARYGELAALQVHDFNPDVGTVTIRQSKGGKARHVILTDEGAAFFRQVCAGRAGSEVMLRKAAGTPWQKSHQMRPMAEAVKAAKIKPPIGFHGLRHTWASLAVMNGTPLLVVAKNLGHTDTRMVEKHYGHLAPSYMVEAIRAGAPRFGFKPDKKIATLAGRAS